jgi:glycerol-3-phosphate acyltransferase PlsX
VTKTITIALDAMGGDHGAPVVVPAALAYHAKNPSCRLILVGKEEVIRQHLPGGKAPEGITLHQASEVVEMDELPSKALRGKKDSSMRVAINLVKEGEADACVSAGNTGALMATSRFVLKTIAGVDRPAICSALPSTGGHCHVLDLGANIDSSAQHLYEFAVMGSELVTALEGKDSPRVALLNIGQEEIKGIEEVKKAHELLKESHLNYKGYAEGDDIFTSGEFDVIVCDGYIGNVALKSAEGVAKMIKHFLGVEFKRNLFTKISALIAMPVLKALARRIDPRRYNGASLLGLNGIVIKSHGGADAKSFANAIGIARKEVEANVAARISEQVSARLKG